MDVTPLEETSLFGTQKHPHLVVHVKTKHFKVSDGETFVFVCVFFSQVMLWDFNWWAVPVLHRKTMMHRAVEKQDVSKK